MKCVKQTLAAAGLLAIAGTAQATLIDFQSLADGVIGESAWETFNLDTDVPGPAYGYDIDVSAGGTGYVYFDSGTAGIGVCSSGLTGTKSVDTAYYGDSTNMCYNSADDNVTIRESLTFTFNETTSLDSIWLNDNHDDGTMVGVTVLLSVNGGPAIEYTFSAADETDQYGLGASIDLSALGLNYYGVGDTLTVSYGGSAADEFYISAIEVPEPAIVALLVMGLIGMGVAQRRKAAK